MLIAHAHRHLAAPLPPPSQGTHAHRAHARRSGIHACASGASGGAAIPVRGEGGVGGGAGAVGALGKWSTESITPAHELGAAASALGQLGLPSLRAGQGAGALSREGQGEGAQHGGSDSEGTDSTLNRHPSTQHTSAALAHSVPLSLDAMHATPRLPPPLQPARARDHARASAEEEPAGRLSAAQWPPPPRLSAGSAHRSLELPPLSDPDALAQELAHRRQRIEALSGQLDLLSGHAAVERWVRSNCPSTSR
jgi:hypothetical protein